MPIDFSKFGKFADEIKQKVMTALADDNKVSENEIREMKLSKNIEAILRQELAGNPEMYEDAYTVTKLNDKEKYTLTLDRKKNEGPLKLTKDSMEYFKKNYPEAEISGAYFKNGIVYLENKFGEQAIDKDGKPIRYSFRNESQNSSIDFVSYYLEHNNGEFDLSKFNTIRAIQDKINLAPNVTESYTSLMQSIKFEEADDEGKTKMLFEQAKQNCANSQNIGELMSNMFTCLMINCQVKDYELGIPEIRQHFNEFFQLDKIANAARDFVNDGDDSKLSVLENIVSTSIGSLKGAEKFMTSTQLLAFAGILTAASLSSEAVGIGEVFAIATTGFFGYEAGSMGVNAILDSIKADTPEEAENAGEQLGAAAMMMLGVAKGAHKIAKNINKSKASTFEGMKEAIMDAKTRDDLAGLGSSIKALDFSKKQKFELNKLFFQKTLEIQSNYSTIQKGILNMYKGEVTPKVAERNKAIKTILENIKEGETITLKEIASKLGISIADVQNSIYNPRFGLKELFEKVNARSSKTKAESFAIEELSPELQELATKQPDVIKMLVNIKKADGTQFHDTEAIKILADESTRMPRFVKILATQVNKDGEPRFTANQIREILHLYYKEPVIAKQLVYTKDAKNEAYKFTAECVETVAQTFESGTTTKKTMARKLLHYNPTAYPNGEVPEYPSEAIIAELTKVVKRGRPPKETSNTQQIEATEQKEPTIAKEPQKTKHKKKTRNVFEQYKAEEANPEKNGQPVDFSKMSLDEQMEYRSQLYTNLYDKLLAKLPAYMKRIQKHGKMSAPSVINIDGHKLGFIIDRTNENKISVKIKQWNSEKLFDETIGRNESGETLSFTLNADGQMTYAMFNTTSRGYGRTTTFTRDKQGKRRIVSNGEHFQPVGNTRRHWVTISGLNIGESRSSFSESGFLMDMLLELAELDAAIEL